MAVTALGMLAACSDEANQGEASRPPEGKAGSIAAEHEDVSRLSGTRWRLVEIRRNNNTTVRPEDPENYVFRFRSDGTLALRLDCNRASGAWMVRAANSGQGEMSVGPLALTRARCPAPTLDTRVARDMDYVRSYVLKGDRLYLRLSANGGLPGLSTSGGLYVLERTEAPKGARD